MPRVGRGGGVSFAQVSCVSPKSEAKDTNAKRSIGCSPLLQLFPMPSNELGTRLCFQTRRFSVRSNRSLCRAHNKSDRPSPSESAQDSFGLSWCCYALH